MWLSISTVLPVFGLILLGWLAGRRGWLGEGAVRVLNNFVVRLALPIWMFHFAATADWRHVWQPGFVAASGGGIAIAFVATLLIGRRGMPLGDRSIAAMAGSYANTLFMGLPICTALFGTIGIAAAAIASLLTVGLLFAIGVLLLEIEAHRDRGIGGAIAGVAAALVRNPMVSAPIAGILWALTGVGLPGPVERLAGMLGAAASPVALVAIGLFLAGISRTAGGQARVPLLLFVKLVVHPAATAALVLLLAVPKPWGAAAILIAALPTGTGPFMLAELYGRAAGAVVRLIFLSTLLSAATLSGLIWLLAG